MFKIESVKYAGRLASGFKDELLEVFQDEENPEIIRIAYADIEYHDTYRSGKQNHCTMTAESGHAILNGKFVGDAEQMLRNAKTIKGMTKPVYGLIKEMGFAWTDNEVWEKIEASPERETQEWVEWVYKNFNGKVYAKNSVYVDNQKYEMSDNETKILEGIRTKETQTRVAGKKAEIESIFAFHEKYKDSDDRRVQVVANIFDEEDFEELRGYEDPKWETYYRQLKASMERFHTSVKMLEKRGLI